MCIEVTPKVLQQQQQGCAQHSVSKGNAHTLVQAADTLNQQQLLACLCLGGANVLHATAGSFHIQARCQQCHIVSCTPQIDLTNADSAHPL
jgi:hypothetical protein